MPGTGRPPVAPAYAPVAGGGRGAWGPPGASAFAAAAGASAPDELAGQGGEEVCAAAGHIVCSGSLVSWSHHCAMTEPESHPI